jgi:hypothetical protein
MHANRHAANNKAYVIAAHQSGDVPILSWTKIHHIPSLKLRNNKISTTFRLTSLLQSIHLSSAPRADVDNNGCQRHTPRI